MNGWIATPLRHVPKYGLAGSERDGQVGRDAVVPNPDHERSRRCAWVRRRRSATGMSRSCRTANGTLATLYFDDASGQLVRMVRHGRSPIGRVPTQVDFSDYRDVGGIKFPFRWTFAWLDGR